MSDVRIFWTVTGMVMGTVFSRSAEQVVLEDAVFVIPTPQNIQFQPILALTVDKHLHISADKLQFGTTDGFEPLPEMRNQYSSHFGSGIQLLG